jgi:hypothetical protein
MLTSDTEGVWKQDAVENNREKVAGGWRRLHNEELHNLYGSPDILG